MKNKIKSRLPFNWRKRIEIKYNKNEFEHTFTIKFIDRKTPIGFHKEIGFLMVSINWGDIDESCIHDERMRGRGLGKMLYEFALNKLGKLTTHFHDCSDDAKRVWRGMVKRHEYTADFWSGELTVRKGTK
jgi:GNAT superfamily N-acetyltransferase